MTEERYLPEFVKGTADDFLAVIQDNYRQACSADCFVFRGVRVSHDTTIAEWFDALDCRSWKKFAKEMNSYWGVNIPLDQWERVLNPAKSRRLRDVCELLANHATLPRIRPAMMLGTSCATAGAFLTVKSYLAEAGANVAEVSPSTPLDAYVRTYARVFLGPVSRLAPGALPAVKVHTPAYFACLWAWLACLALIAIGGCSRIWALQCLGAFFGIFTYISLWIAARCIPPASVEFGELRTFRDLSRVLVREPRRGVSE